MSTLYDVVYSTEGALVGSGDLRHRGFERKSRLTPADPLSDLSPWRRAEELRDVRLYWMPVASFPVPAEQRQWLMEFFDRLDLVTKERYRLRAELFLNLRSFDPSLSAPFADSALEFKPLMGVGWRPGAGSAHPLRREDIEALQQGRKRFDLTEFMDDHCCWFVAKSATKQRELFFGHGGMTIFYLTPDRNTQAPKLPTIPPKLRAHPMFRGLFEQFDIDQMNIEAHAMLDGFLAKSKELFGGGAKGEPRFRKAAFIVPLFSADDFFQSPSEERENWFKLFDVYINESPIDQGILLASKLQLEGDLVEILSKMKEESLVYPER